MVLLVTVLCQSQQVQGRYRCQKHPELRIATGAYDSSHFENSHRDLETIDERVFQATVSADDERGMASADSFYHVTKSVFVGREFDHDHGRGLDRETAIGSAREIATATCVVLSTEIGGAKGSMSGHANQIWHAVM